MVSDSAVSKRTPAGEVRSSLIAAGRRILEEKGVGALTVRAVAAEAGVAPMGVYNRFSGKDGLLSAVVTDGFEQFAAEIASTDPDPTTRLLESGRAYRRFAVANPRLYSLMFGGGTRPHPETAGSAFAELVTVVQYGQVGGVIHDGDPTAIAMTVWSCVHGAVSLELAVAAPDEADLSANYERVISLVARGLAPTAE